MMPKVDGLQLLERLKGDERFRDLPVLMLSSMPPEEGTVKALGLGAADFIAKPFRVKELLARVEAHLRIGQALAQAREEARSRAAMVDILHEVTDSLKPDEIYNILVRRVARVLNISRCSMVLAKPGDERGVVVAAYENPMLRNLEIELSRYPEIRRAIADARPVLVEDVATDALYATERDRWTHDGISVPTRSAVAIPFSMRDQQRGVFFLRTTGDDPALTAADASFAETVIHTAVAAIEKAYDFESAVSDKQRLEKLAATDVLTGCLNRRGMADALEQELERARRYSLAVSLLLADIDRFKQVNDTHGHVAGDSVLRQVGELLRREARSVDIVARYGGEEFVVVMPETALHGAAIFAERLRRRIAARDFADPGQDPLHLTVSIGLAAFPDDRAQGAESFVAIADQALYRAKRSGRNRVSMFAGPVSPPTTDAAPPRAQADE
jgi:two-component system cell cycle response regulator